MPEKTENKAVEAIEQIQERNSSTLTLSNGTKVTINEPTTPQILKARNFAVKDKDAGKTYLYLIAECCKFGGKIVPAPEIMKLRPRDYLAIENVVRDLLGENDEDDEKNY